MNAWQFPSGEVGTPRKLQPQPARSYRTRDTSRTALQPATRRVSQLDHRGFAEQGLGLGEEVRHRLDAVLRAELERARALRRLQRHDHRRVAGKVLDEPRELAD